MSWNPMFDECIKLKKDYFHNFGELKDNIDFKYMIEMMKKYRLPYNPIFNEVQINQHGDLVLVRYGLHEMGKGMWEDKNSPLREARSLVFNLRTEEMVLTPFRKFFNLNEVWETSTEVVEVKIKYCKIFEVSEKMDGSMQSYRWYNGDIVGSGSMALDPKKSFRLEEGLEMLTENHKRMLKDFPTVTFIFEYISEKDKHVVPYDYSKKKGLYLIGARSVIDGEEYSYNVIKDISSCYGIPCCKTYQYNTLSEVLEHLNKMTVRDGEGFVLNIDGFKLKLKCEDYLQLHRLDDKLSSPNVIIQAYAEGTIDDLYANMTPLMKEKNKDVMDVIEKFMYKMKHKINMNLDEIDMMIRFDGTEEENNKKLHKFINEFVDKDVREYVRMTYLGREYSILKSRGGKYRKIEEIRKWVDKN